MVKKPLRDPSSAALFGRDKDIMSKRFRKMKDRLTIPILESQDPEYQAALKDFKNRMKKRGIKI